MTLAFSILLVLALLSVILGAFAHVLRVADDAKKFRVQSSAFRVNPEPGTRNPELPSPSRAQGAARDAIGRALQKHFARAPRNQTRTSGANGRAPEGGRGNASLKSEERAGISPTSTRNPEPGTRNLQTL